VTAKAPSGEGGSILQMEPRQRGGRLRVISTLGSHQTTDGAGGRCLFTAAVEKRGATAPAAPVETEHRSHLDT
jgi:hypothetical protein